MTDRLREIRVRGYRMPMSVYLQGVAAEHYPADVAYLCQRIRELEQEVERLREQSASEDWKRGRWQDIHQYYEEGIIGPDAAFLLEEIGPILKENERLREVVRKLSEGATSALSTWVPADSVTHEELRAGLRAARERGNND